MMTMQSTLQEKLHPERFSDMSPKMAAIVGCVVGRKFTEPGISHLSISSDGWVLSQTEGDIGANDFLGAANDLERNWANLLDAAGLTDEERQAAMSRFKASITDWRT